MAKIFHPLKLLLSAHPFMKTLDWLGDTDASYRLTPVVSEADLHLMICCISVNNEIDGTVVPKDTLAKLRIVSSTSHGQSYSMSCELLSNLVIPLPERSLIGNSFCLSLSFDGNVWTDLIKLALDTHGCRVNHVPVPGLELSLCFVHDTVHIESDIDLFIEQQDFLYNCMEIQEEVHLLGKGPELSDLFIPHQEEKREIWDESQTPLNHELRVMNSLIAKYESSKSLHTRL